MQCWWRAHAHTHADGGVCRHMCSGSGLLVHAVSKETKTWGTCLGVININIMLNKRGKNAEHVELKCFIKTCNKAFKCLIYQGVYALETIIFYLHGRKLKNRIISYCADCKFLLLCLSKRAQTDTFITLLVIPTVSHCREFPFKACHCYEIIYSS